MRLLAVADAAQVLAPGSLERVADKIKAGDVVVVLQLGTTQAGEVGLRPVGAYGIHTFDWAADWAARAKPAAMAANCAHPARMVLGPGGL